LSIGRAARQEQQIESNSLAMQRDRRSGSTMARNFDFQQISLHQAVGEVLHYLWDPIGVTGVPQARDEYDGYVDHICGMLHQDIAESSLAGHLVHIADRHMGLFGTGDRAALAARRLLACRDVMTR
jgi:hypothetical protein